MRLHVQSLGILPEGLRPGLSPWSAWCVLPGEGVHVVCQQPFTFLVQESIRRHVWRSGTKTNWRCRNSGGGYVIVEDVDDCLGG